MATVPELKDLLHSLDQKKHDIEASLAAKQLILNQNGVGMDDSLVDNEGFPRNDIDVYQVRHARHDIICLRNDLKNLMTQFEDNLFKLHSLVGREPEALHVETKALAFARVSAVENLSPAFIDGLVEDDEIVNFGSINEKNFRSMKDISDLVQHSIDREIPLTVRRKGRELRVTLKPRRWSGRGILGCTIVPIDIPGPDQLLIPGKCHIRVWTAVSNWSSGNWFNGIPPSCEGDRIYFPEIGIVSLTVPSGLIFRELILPGNGELVLDDNIKQVLNPDAKGCRGKDVFYNASVPKSWFDPSAWSIEIPVSDVDPYTWNPAKNKRAIPHLERIPCEKDVVKFPEKASFLVNFENEAVIASRWMHGERNISLVELSDLLSSYDTKFRFLNLPKTNPVTLDQTAECTERNCFCDPAEKKKRLPVVCSTPGATCEIKFNHCDGAIRPEGHCCAICGALVHMQIPRENFLLSVFEKLVVRHLKSPESEDIVEGYIGVTKQNDSVVHLQAVFTDDGDASKSIGLAKKLEKELFDDMKNENIYRILSLKAEYSGFAYGILPGSIILNIFGIIVIIGFIAGILYFLRGCYSPTKEAAFTFARFENTAGRGSVSVVVETDPKSSISDSGSIRTESSTVPSAPQSPSGGAPLVYLRRQFRRLSSFSRNFINPLFGNAAAEHYATSVNLSSLVQEAPTSDNPFYDAATQQGLTDAELAQATEVNIESLDLRLGEKLKQENPQNGMIEKTNELEASDSHLTLESIAEENLEEVCLDETELPGKEEDTEVAGESSNNDSEVAAALKKTKKKKGKGLLKRVIGRKLQEDNEVLVEKEESEA